MSKNLYLMRHAKSTWDNPSVGDRERDLNKRGHRDAQAMGAALPNLIAPMSVRVSPAQRAQLTLAGMQAGWPELRQCKHKVVEELYTFAAKDLVEYLRGQDDAEYDLFLLGHNPAMTELANWICGEAVLGNLPTAGFVHLSLLLEEWAALEAGCGHLQQRLFPQEL